MPISNVAFIFIFLIPYLALSLHPLDLHLFDSAEFFWALKNSLIQAFGTSILGLSVSYVMALGLNGSRYKNLFELLLVMTSLTPVLLSILLFMHWVKPFPFGHTGVILIQVFVFSGLTCVSVARVMENKLSSYADMAYIYGLNKLRFQGMCFPIIKKDLLQIFLSLFVSSFASFTIPVMAGGGTGTNLEVLIFEKFRNESTLGFSISLGWMQLFLLMGLGFFLKPADRAFRRIRQTQVNSPLLLKSKTGLLVLIFYLGFFWLGTLLAVIQGVYAILLHRSVISWAEILSLILPSLSMALAVGFATFALCFVFGWIFISGTLDRFLTCYISPSQALMGLGGILLIYNLDVSPVVLYFLFLVLMFLPTLYRMLLQVRVRELQTQKTMAYLLGAEPLLIFRKIVYPQLRSPALFCGFVAAVWTLGDFALARTLLAKNVTVAMVIETLINSYRTEAAFGLTGVLFLMAATVFAIYKGIDHVLGQKA